MLISINKLNKFIRVHKDPLPKFAKKNVVYKKVIQINRMAVQEANSLKKKSTKDTLFFVNAKTICFFLAMEKIFRVYYKTICSLHEKINVVQFFVSRFKEIPYSILNCYNLKNKIIKKYCIFKLRIASQNKAQPSKAVTRNRKTMAMHSSVQ
ncbi:hypothetical protein ALC56_08187 [Trachymyrmex septentrionalis]|uniref:Uncharacterized protein n=1 Tax=Trachymyrmex septentrionalis TaxID=34720 RepID=A0A151JV80_9HYME|nr:hypothetical protein ALC56_08187 [Trachymyrmex septentrionalis]